MNPTTPISLARATSIILQAMRCTAALDGAEMDLERAAAASAVDALRQGVAQRAGGDPTRTVRDVALYAAEETAWRQQRPGKLPLRGNAIVDYFRSVFLGALSRPDQNPAGRYNVRPGDIDVEIADEEIRRTMRMLRLSRTPAEGGSKTKVEPSRVREAREALPRPEWAGEMPKVIPDVIDLEKEPRR